MAFFIAIGNPEVPAFAKMMEIYRQMGEELYFRPLEVFKELVKPWHSDELGYRTVNEWHGIEVEMSEEELEAFGIDYGVYLVK